MCPVPAYRYTIGLLLVICCPLSIWLKDMVSATYLAVALGCVVAVTGIVSWLVEGVSPAALVGGMVIGFVGTLGRIAVRPVTDTLVLEATGFAVLGVFLGATADRILKAKRRCGMKGTS